MFGLRSRAKVRSLSAGIAVLALLTACPPANAQDEKLWKQYMMDAMKSAGDHDYPKSEQAFVKALHQSENFGPSDMRIGSTLNSLGLVYRAEKKYSDAEGAYRRALVIMQAAYGESVDVGNINFNIAGVMFDEGRQTDALPYLQKALAIYQRLLGDSSLKTAATLCMEGDAFRLTKRYTEAEAALRKCADIREMDSGLESNDLADALYSLAQTLALEGKLTAADARFGLVEKIREKTLGITDPLLAQTLEDHASVLKALGRDREAGNLTEMAAAIRRRQKGK
jgi:tetratricopeptide (TPR) repeat protein